MRTLPVLFLLTALSTTASAVPTQLTHQGRIFDGAGAPLDSLHDVQFTLFDAPSAGAQLWTETLSLDFDNGYFSTVLGDTTPVESSLLDGSQLYLELAVDSGAPLPTRVLVVSVPYALQADVATSVSGGIVNATEIQINGATVIDGDGISYTDLTDVPDDADVLGGLSCADGEIAAWDASAVAWACATTGGPHDHDASSINTGSLDIARIPTGTSSDTVAAGDHAHSAADVGAIPTTGGTADDLIVSGTLDAQAGVVLGTTDTCTATEEGTVRYTTGVGIEYCDGTSFVTAAGDDPATTWEPLFGTTGKTELYHFAMAVPGALEISSAAFGGNKMPICAPLTDDNEPGPLGTPHASDFQNGYILGYSSDENGHCLSGSSDWVPNGTCVALLVSNWEEYSHEGYGAWCKTSVSNGNIVWAQINVEHLTYQNSSNDGVGDIAKPVNVGDIECVASGYACVKRVR